MRPWVEAHGGSGCCSGDTREAIGLEGRTHGATEHPYETRVLARAYSRLRDELPDVDVQIVSSSNTAYLVPTVLRGVHRHGLWEALRRTNAATRPGALLVDGDYAGDIVELGPSGVVATVRALTSRS